jgi:hypothetical protein
MTDKIRNELTSEFGGDRIEDTWRLKGDGATVRAVAGWLWAKKEAEGWTVTRRTGASMSFDNGLEVAWSGTGDNMEVIVW